MVITISLLDAKEFKTINNDIGQRIEIDGFNYLNVPGKPLIPSKNVMIALPPGAQVRFTDVKLIDMKQLPGTFKIMPSPQILPLDDVDEKYVYQEEWQENYDLTYFSDKAYPYQSGKLTGFGTLRKYSYVSVSIYPFRYHPQSGRLYYYESAEVVIQYEIYSIDNAEEMKWDTLADEQASDLFVNYNKINDLYQPNKPRPLSDSYDYVIITTNDLSDAITSSDFIIWKTALGYDVKIIYISDDEITSQSGVDLAEQIRNFLREYYLEWGIQYVLFVGDYETVPMRYCYPNPNNHQNTAGTPGGSGGEVPTDYYYADLSSSDEDSWD